jgi:hypothetical protein
MEQGTGTCSTFETKKKDRPFQTAPIFLSHTRAYAQRGGNCRQYANDNLNHSSPIFFLHTLSFFWHGWPQMATDIKFVRFVRFVFLNSFRVNPCPSAPN